MLTIVAISYMILLMVKSTVSSNARLYVQRFGAAKVKSKIFGSKLIRVRLWQQNLDRPHIFFSVIASIFGLIFVFIMPPYQNIDEPSHFYRSYQLSQGVIIGENADGVTGGTLPESVSESAKKYSYLFSAYDQKIQPESIIKDAGSSNSSNDVEFTEFNNSVIYPPITYLPQAIGIKVATIFSNEPLIALYSARLFSLVTWILVTFFVIKMLPIGKWTFAVISLFPMILVQAASASSDATVNSVTILVVGLIITLIWRENTEVRLDRIRLTLLGIAALLLALIKIPAFGVLLFMLAIPSQRFKGIKSKFIYTGIVFSVGLGLIIIWNLAMLHIRVELRNDTSVSNQLSFIQSNPLGYVKALVFYPLQTHFDETIIQMYGWLGWNEIKLPLWMTIFGFGSFVLTIMDPSYKRHRIGRRERLLASAVFVIMTFSIVTLLYLSWMPVGHFQLYDIWGRYFVSLLYLCAVIFGGLVFLDRNSWCMARRVIILVTPVVLLVVVLLILNRFYGSLPLGNSVI